LEAIASVVLGWFFILDEGVILKTLYFGINGWGYYWLLFFSTGKLAMGSKGVFKKKDSGSSAKNSNIDDRLVKEKRSPGLCF